MNEVNVKIIELNRHDMKVLESYIKNIDKLRYQLRLRRFELLDNPVEDNPGSGKSNLPGDPTSREVAVCLTDSYYMHLDKVITSIERLYDGASDDVKEIFNLKYWEPIMGIETWDDIAKHKHYSRTSILRMRAKYLTQLANDIDYIKTDF